MPSESNTGRIKMRPFQYNTISENLIVFFHTLRDDGFLIGSREIEDALIALNEIDVMNEATFKETLKIIVCTSKVERERFEYYFRQFIFNISANYDDRFTTTSVKKRETEDESESYEIQRKDENEPPEKDKSKQANNKESGEFVALLQDREEVGETEETALQRAINIIQKNPQVRKIFVPHYQFALMKQAARIFLTKTEYVNSRRKTIVSTGNTIDIRKTIRKSLSTGGIPIQPVLIGKRKKASRLLFFIDSSRSMANFSKIYVQFAFALSHFTNELEIFLFSTEIKNVTKQLRLKSDRRFPLLTLNENEWEGGTSIGESLSKFLYDEGNRLLTKDTICIIASDGLDAGEITYLQEAMRSIHDRSRFVLWFNPLLNMTGYEPTARGMNTALPFIDYLSEAVDADGMLKMAKNIQIKR